MTPMFLVVAALAVTVAVVFVVVPLLRRDNPERAGLQHQIDDLDDAIDDLEPGEYAERRKSLRRQLQALGNDRSIGLGLVVGLALLVPVGTFLLYQQVGEPDGITPSSAPAAELRTQLIRIANQLERNPDDAEQWAQLGLAYKAIEQFTSAAHAFRRALYIDADNPFIMVELAETLLFTSQGSRLPVEAQSLLETAVRTDPGNQKGLWLLGIGAFQGSDYEQALRWWRQLEGILPPGSVQNSVREQIQRAEARLGQAAPGQDLPEGHPPIEATNGEQQPGFRVEVSIDPTLAERLSGSETVFVIARAAEGPPAPLAVRRLSVAELPASVVLSDGDAMVEGLELSRFPEIILTARVSFSGDAQARDGDFEGRSGPLSIFETASAEIRIDRIVGTPQE